MEQAKKVCSKCHTKYPATTEYFYKAKDGRDGLTADCILCRRIYDNKKYLKKRKKETFEITPYSHSKLAVSIPTFLKKHLQAIAKQEDCSMSWIVCEALVKRLNLPEKIISDLAGYELPKEMSKRPAFWDKIKEERGISRIPRGTFSPKAVKVVEPSFAQKLSQYLASLSPCGSTKQDIVKYFGVSDKTIQRAVNNLKEKGFVEVQYKGVGGKAYIRFIPQVKDFAQDEKIELEKIPEKTEKVKPVKFAKVTPEVKKMCFDMLNPKPKNPFETSYKSPAQIQREEQEYYEKKYGRE